MASDGIKLFLLALIEEPRGYDYFRRFLIAAKSAAQARKMADKNVTVFRTGQDGIWLDPKQTTLRCLALDSMCKKEEILIGEFIGG